MKQFYCQCGRAVFFDSGQCLEDGSISLKTWQVRVQDNRVQLAG